MKAITPFWHEPKHQVAGKPKVEFELRPLNQRTLYAVQGDIGKRGVGVDGAMAAFEYGVINWRGLDIPFSEAAKRIVMESDEGDINWTVWMASIAGALYKRAVLSETDAKNS